jgi:hypothetical protein
MEAWLCHCELSMNNHSMDATVQFLGDRHMRPLTIVCIISYNFELELIDKMMRALIRDVNETWIHETET